MRNGTTEGNHYMLNVKQRDLRRAGRRDAITTLAWCTLYAMILAGTVYASLEFAWKLINLKGH